MYHLSVHVLHYATHDTRLTEDFEMLRLTPDFEILRLTCDFKTLRLTPARSQPEATFQNHVTDIIRNCIDLQCGCHKNIKFSQTCQHKN